MRTDIRPAGIFSGYPLPDHIDTEPRLRELRGDDPLIPT